MINILGLAIPVNKISHPRKDGARLTVHQRLRSNPFAAVMGGPIQLRLEHQDIQIPTNQVRLSFVRGEGLRIYAALSDCHAAHVMLAAIEHGIIRGLSPGLKWDEWDHADEGLRIIYNVKSLWEISLTEKPAFPQTWVRVGAPDNMQRKTPAQTREALANLMSGKTNVYGARTEAADGLSSSHGYQSLAARQDRREQQNEAEMWDATLDRIFGKRTK